MVALPASYGSSGARPPLLSIAASDISVIFEWAALLPLAVYLASSRFSHQLVGQTALTRTICVGLFPRLGVLSSIANFLQNGPDFLDRASSVSELRRTVWDVKWGSVFPCANGAASAMLGSYVLRHIKPEDIPEPVDMDQKDQKDHDDTTPSPSTSAQVETHAPLVNAGTSNCPTLPVSQPVFRRYQTLHVLDFSGPVRDKPSSHDCLNSTILRNACKVLVLVGLLGACVVTILFGLYGTATAILVTILFRLCKLLIRVRRPSGYLYSNEGESGCMLVALHENASTWYLYKGSRAVVDTLLNKTMIESITSPLGIWLAYALRFMEFLQLIAMTYVASQKGWDGVALLCLVAVAWAYDHVAYSDDKIAATWLRHEFVVPTAQTYRFGGRTAMIGTIQALSNTSVTSWMDGILAPSDRRDVWLSKVAGHPATEKLEALSIGDRKWVDLNMRLTEQALKTLGRPEAASA
ncbi:hypothetical protein VP1G_02848 [Cytospora mali]|uniref:Uncharacterized protein n=1 Tax=Cytospora mali TaxID=578113 RepID=A0A194UUX9_CYTMA|nr:hypothetical protein VP1G_02848 [Valsa mali var. pyri (nom. inval.)]